MLGCYKRFVILNDDDDVDDVGWTIVDNNSLEKWVHKVASKLFLLLLYSLLQYMC
jgi:hypothetical protein